MRKTELISKLLDFKHKEKFRTVEWDERGLNPSSDSVIHDMKMLINSFVDKLIQKLEIKFESQDFKTNFIQLLKKFHLENYDTEEKEFIIDYLYKVSNLCDLKIPNELNKLLYGEAITDLIREEEQFEKSKSKKFIQSYKVDEPCQNCNQPLKSLAIEDKNQIGFIGIAECFKCNKETLVHFPEEMKTIEVYNFKVIEKIPFSKENEVLLKEKIKTAYNKVSVIHKHKKLI